MSTSFAQASKCQVLKRDMLDILLLSPKIVASTASPSGAATALGAAAGLLTEAHVRGLLANTFVRTAIPKAKQAALLFGNVYVQAAIASKGEAPSPAGATGGEHKQPSAEQIHRVGRVVALLRKPTAATTSTTSTTSNDADPAAWLLAVDLGECVVLLPLKYISSEPFSMEEHSVYVHSVLGDGSAATVTEGSGGASTASATTAPKLMSGEQLAAVRETLADLRRALQLASSGADRDATNNNEDAASQALVRMGEEAAVALQHSKRLREAEDQSEEDSPHHPNHTTRRGVGVSVDYNDEVAEREMRFGTGALSLQARLTRMSSDLMQQTTQLQHMRQLLSSKDAEVMHLTHLIRRAEQTHSEEAARWRAKLEEGSKERSRVTAEGVARVKELNQRLGEANTKLRHLAEMTTRYKKVSDRVAALLDGGGSTASRRPEDVLAALDTRAHLFDAK